MAAQGINKLLWRLLAIVVFASFINIFLIYPMTNSYGGNGNEENIPSPPAAERLQVNEIRAESSSDYEAKLAESLKGLPGAKTASYTRIPLAGLCNQYQRFVGMSFLATQEGYDEIIEESILWKDTYGTNEMIPHYMLWDVVHWNTFYPTIPRFASFDSKVHTDLVLSTSEVKYGEDTVFIKKGVRFNPNISVNIYEEATPRGLGRNPNQAINRFMQFEKKLSWGHTLPETVMYKTILGGALRPHPNLQLIINNTIAELNGAEKKGYMVLHARIEPDMMRQNVRVCTDKRVMNMTDIINMLYEKFPEPPVSAVLLVFSRDIIENEEANDKQDDDFHKLNSHNLKILNELRENGMWGGKVKVVEAGSRMVEESGNDFYAYYYNFVGSIVNFFIAVQAAILVGTEVSTFSTYAMNSRFYRESRENYFYRPGGLYWMSPPNQTKPHRFGC
mmetsp:Transcript_25450/g.38106  ORF Transcript_25450/g.38106 Transcript_25450/m.38106 type:complete len:447 (+) Transcript_25450:22-1362(+)